MPFNGTGTFENLDPPDFPAVPGTVIRASQLNNNLIDVAAGLSNCITADGQTPLTSNIPLGGFRFTGASDGVADQDFLTLAQFKAPDAAEDLKYLASGTGAVIQTLQQKLRSEQVNLWDFLSDAKRTTILAGTQTDVTTELQAALDSFTTFGTVAIFGNLKITATIYLKRNGMRLLGYGIGNTFLEFINAAGGTALAGAVSDMDTITDCEIANFFLAGSVAGTAPSISLDITTFAYSRFDLSIQTRRVNGICIYGEGNNGSSPYYNRIQGYWFGGSDRSQIGLRFAPGAWTGGSNGCNANSIGPIGRAASLRYMLDLEAGNGNIFTSLSGESINDAYILINNVAATTSGTATGATGITNLNDAGAAWTVNAFVGHAVTINAGTGATQTRIISANTATALTISLPWGIIPDATSTYSIYKNSSGGHKFFGIRGEGLSTDNPDFINARPGTQDCFVHGTHIDSLGTGLFVRDKSGATDNTWFDGGKTVFSITVTDPGPSANINLYPRNSAFGGLTMPKYVVEWLSVASHVATPGDSAIVYLDVGGTAPNNGDMTLQANLQAATDHAVALPTEAQKTVRDGTQKHLFLNVQTGAAFGVNTDLIITFCVTVDP